MKNNLSFYLRAAQKKLRYIFLFPAAQLIYKLPEYIFLLPQISTINQYIFFKRYRKKNNYKSGPNQAPSCQLLKGK